MARRSLRSTVTFRKGVGRGGRVLEKLRGICLGFPGAIEKVSHGEPTWFAGSGRVFAMFDNHHHGGGHVSVHVPLPPGAQGDLVTLDPGRFWIPPYVGGAGWVGIILDAKPDWTLVGRLVREAFVLVASRKLVAQLEQQKHATPRLKRPRRTL